MRKISIILIYIFLCVSTAWGDSKITALSELTAVSGSDILYIIDDPAGTPTSKKITVTNLFDIIDTSAELYGILTDETGSGGGTPLAVFNYNPTLTGFTLAADASFGNYDITAVDRLSGVDTDIYIDMGTDGYLDLEADTGIRITAPTDFGDEDLSSIDKLEGYDSGVYVDLGADGRIIILADGAGTPFSTPDIDFTGSVYFDDDIGLALDKALQFGDGDVFIESDDDGYLDLDADTGIRFNGPMTTTNTYDATISTTTAGGETGLYSYITHITNALTGELIGVRGNARVNAIDSASGTVMGGKFQAGNMGTGTDLLIATGVYVDVVNKIPSGATTWTNARGYEVSMDLDQGSAGNVNTVTNAYMFYGVYNLPTVDTYATVTNGYGIYVKNEAVGGTGQMLDAAFYAADASMSGGIYGWDFGIDFSGIASGAFGTADIRGVNSETIDNNTDGTWDFSAANLLTTGNIAGATYGSDSSVTDAELLYVDATSSIQTQLDERCLESVFGTSLGAGIVLDGTSLKIDVTDALTWTGVQTFGDLTLTSKTSAPGSPVGGTWYRADDATWDPAGLSLGYDYFVIYDDNATSYKATFDERGGLHATSITTVETEPIPVDYMDNTAATNPAALATITGGSNSRKWSARAFDGSSDENLSFNWYVPLDISTTDGIKFRWVAIVSNADPPTDTDDEDVTFYLQGVSIGDNDSGDPAAFGTAVASAFGATAAQYDIVYGAWSTAITVTSLAVGEMAHMNLYRDADAGDHPYDQDIDLIGIEIKYKRLHNATF